MTPAIRAIQVLSTQTWVAEELQLRSIEIADDLGFTWIRLPIDVLTISGSTPAAARDYSRLDLMVWEARRCGLGVILVLTGTVYGKAGWNAHTAPWVVDSADIEPLAELYEDIAVRAHGILGAGRLVLQLGNEDANPNFGGNAKKPLQSDISTATNATPIRVTTAGLRFNTVSGNPDPEGSDTMLDVGGHANLLREARTMIWRELQDNACAVPGVGVGFVTYFTAMHTECEYDNRANSGHFGLANHWGQVYESAAGIAAVNGKAVSYKGPPLLDGGPDVGYGPAPEPSLTEPAACE